MVEKESALAKAAEAMVQSIKQGSVSVEAKMEKHVEYENECREKYSVPEAQSCESQKEDEVKDAEIVEDEKPVEEVALLSHERKISVLYELLSACLADKHEENEKCTRSRKGYDARHHVALRLLATWFDIQWIKMVCLLHSVKLSKAFVNLMLPHRITTS